MNSLTLKKQQSIREIISWKIAYGLKPLYFFMRRNRKAWAITMEDLQQMPNGTLGKDLALFLIRHNLQIMPKAEFHDVYHVLFGYETNIRDEACIQFVPLGNGRYSLPYVACTFISAAFYPEYWEDFYAAYSRGRRANHFHDWDFEPLLMVKTEVVRKMIFDK
jgi:hypothetical protein